MTRNKACPASLSIISNSGKCNLPSDNGESVRLYDAPFKPEDAKVDIVLCTHAHIDHLAPETIKGMYKNNPGTTIVAPLECAEILSSLGVADNDIQIINPGAAIDLDGIKVEAFLTEHPKRGEGGSVAYLANIIKPDLVIPMHYDMVKDNTENPLRLLEKFRSMNWNKKSMVPLLGERVMYKKG